MSDWPITIDGLDYYPVPRSWIDHGSDRDHGSPRVYAVSVAHSTRDLIKVRYVARDGGVYVSSMSSAPNPTSEEGYVPASLEQYQDWPRSLVPPRDMDPVDHARSIECERISEVWSDIDSSDSIESDSRPIADGGEPVEPGTDASTALRVALRRSDHLRSKELIREALQIEETVEGGPSNE